MLESNWSQILAEEAETELGLAPARSTPALPPLFFHPALNSPNPRSTIPTVPWVFQPREFHARYNTTRSVGTQTELQLVVIPTLLAQHLSTIKCCPTDLDSATANDFKYENSTSASRLSDRQASIPIGRQRSQSLTPDLEACRAIGAQLRSLADTLNPNDGAPPTGRTKRSTSVFGSIFS